MARSFRRLLWPHDRRHGLFLAAILLAALALRLQVWHWHRLYPLGGDEREYFDQALTWLQGKGYRDLPLMRPPLYPVFLAGVFQLFDSQVQRVRLVQAFVSAATVYLQWLLARLALDPSGGYSAAPLVAAALTGLSFTLAANATELLAETTFLFGLTLVFCLILAAGLGSARRGVFVAVGGSAVALLALLRSVALPLLPLGCVWLVFVAATRRGSWRRPSRAAAAAGVLFLAAGVLTIAPWTLRNYLTYGRPIIVDTTGAENLWLDNDPAGREAVKRALYALGDDRGARQELGLRRGIQVLAEDPARFAGKAFAEAQKLVALEYWDDLRARPAIWIPPVEVWLRLVLGDALWLLLAGAGGIGLWLLPGRLQWLFVPWALYVVLTNLIFHVELRYRLPLYPVLSLAAASLLAGRPWRSFTRPRLAGALATVSLFVLLLLLHRPYFQEGAMLAVKHWRLWRGDGMAALRADPESALARVAIARDELRDCAADPGACDRAEGLLREAIILKPAHPYARLLRGALLRRRGMLDQARAEFDYETASLEDLQRWMVHVFGPRAARRVDIGDGLDLGDIEGFYPAGDGHRWSTREATIWLRRPEAQAVLRLRLAGGRPVSVPVRVSVGGKELGRIMVAPDWQTYELPLPADAAGGSQQADGQPGVDLVPVTIIAPTFRPRDLDHANQDNRPLGIQVDWAELEF